MYRNLEAWKKTYTLGLKIYKLTSNFPREEMFGLTSQMRRSATSIAANIAEGNARNYSKEFSRFISIARGSAAELETWIMFSKDLGYISDDDYKKLSSDLDKLKGLLFGLQRSIEKHN